MRVCRWIWTLHKRLYKQAVFLLLLALMLASAVLLYVSSRQDSGFVHILLVEENGGDATSAQIVADCMENGRLLVFEECASRQEAVELVKKGQADAVWVLPVDIDAKIEQFVKGHGRAPFVTVIEREQTVPLLLAREKLTAVLYRYCSSHLYIAYARAALPQLNDMSDADLLAYYDAFEVNAPLFSFSYPDGEMPDETVRDMGYLLAPARGLLSVFVLISGIAAAIWYLRDAQKGTYSLFPASRRPLLVFVNCLVAVMQVAIVMLISLYCMGLTVDLWREVTALLLYVLACVLFCMVLQLVFGRLQVLSALIPLLSVVMIAVCPVFFDWRQLVWLQLLFPPTYYINAIHSDALLVGTAAYCAVLALVYILLQKMLRLQK